MLRFAENVAAAITQNDVELTDTNGHVRYLPGAAADLCNLARLLREPRDSDSLHAALPLSLAEPLRLLVDAGVVVDDPVPDQLLALHRKTLEAGNSQVDGRCDEAYLTTTRVTDGPIIPLKPVRGDSLAKTAILSRRSCRSFDTDAWLGLPLLGHVLGIAAGSVHGYRAYPSAGGLYPIEILVGALRVSDVEAGASLRYDPCRAVLTRGAVIPPATWLSALPGLGSADPAAVLLLTVDLARPSGSRYAERGYRFAVLEAGHLAQSLMLAATHYGLGSLGVGAISEEVLTSGGVFGHMYEVAVYAVAIGGPAVG